MRSGILRLILSWFLAILYVSLLSSVSCRLSDTSGASFRLVYPCTAGSILLWNLQDAKETNHARVQDIRNCRPCPRLHLQLGVELWSEGLTSSFQASEAYFDRLFCKVFDALPTTETPVSLSWQLLHVCTSFELRACEYGAVGTTRPHAQLPRNLAILKGRLASFYLGALYK